MGKQKKISIRAAAARLVGGKPKAHKLLPDGSLVVIGPDGRKVCFSADEVRTVRTPEDGDESKPIKKAG